MRSARAGPSARDADDAPVAEAPLEDQDELLAADLGDGIVAPEALLHAGGDAAKALAETGGGEHLGGPGGAAARLVEHALQHALQLLAGARDDLVADDEGDPRASGELGRVASPEQLEPGPGGAAGLGVGLVDRRRAVL